MTVIEILVLSKFEKELITSKFVCIMNSNEARTVPQVFPKEEPKQSFKNLFIAA